MSHFAHMFQQHNAQARKDGLRYAMSHGTPEQLAAAYNQIQPQLALAWGALDDEEKSLYIELHHRAGTSGVGNANTATIDARGLLKEAKSPNAADKNKPFLIDGKPPTNEQMGQVVMTSFSMGVTGGVVTGVLGTVAVQWLWKGIKGVFSR